MSIEKLKKDVRATARKHNVKIYTPKAKHIRYGKQFSNGYFSEPFEGKPAKLAVAIGKPPIEWLHTFVHESCHMDQWIEQIPIWLALDNVNEDGLASNDIIDAWLEGTDISEKTLDTAFHLAREVERDCEERSLNKLRKYGITELNLDETTQRCNAYIFFYTFMRKHRKWYKPGKEPYTLETVWRKMPTVFVKDYTVISEEHELAMMDCIQ